MSWSSQGSLYENGAYLNRTVPDCLAHAAKLMLTHDVDILWISDARFTQGTLDRNLYLLRADLTDYRVLKFPTTHVNTGSQCQQNNQMGGTIAIVNYKWSKFIVEGSLYTDPMGLGIINSIDIRLDDYWVRSVNVYFMCTSVMTCLATLHYRVT
jgi:hypothetical protein